MFSAPMSSQENKSKRHRKKSPFVLRQTQQFASLPHELVVSCLARVSKAYYPTLSLVCKSFRSLIASPELYQTRSLLNRTESFLYVCIKIHRDPNPRWFTLYRTPSSDVRKKKKKPTLVPISSPFVRAEPRTSSRVVVGSDIYEIGGHINGVPSSSVWVFDCQSQKWHKAPDMLEKRKRPSAKVIDGKIYVLGGWKEGSLSSGWIEVFDPKTQTWNHVSSPGTEIYNNEVIYNAVVIDGKLDIYTCELLDPNLCGGLSIFDYQVINNMLIRFDNLIGVFQWYSTKAREWRNLKGLKGLLPCSGFVEYADYGGKMVVLWDERVSHTLRTGIWCAEITLERCNNEEEILGTVVWFDVVLEVPFCSAIMRALVASV